MSKKNNGVQVNNSILTQESENVVVNNEELNLKINFFEHDGYIYLEEKFDKCIDGFDLSRGSIIYDMNTMIDVLMEEIDNDSKWKGRFEDNCKQFVYCHFIVCKSFKQFGNYNPSFPCLKVKF